jgi:DNA repair exonuclease SbcCD ATPase subunit
VVQLSGANGSGKSSVLDCIWWAIAGTKTIDAEPIRRGATSARIRLDLGELIITRRFTENGTTLTVEQENGARFPSPQKMLDDLFGSLTFDPLTFTRMTPREQLEQLRKLVTLDVDLDTLAALNRRDFEDRTGVNREIKSLQAQADALEKTLAVELPEEPVDVNSLLDELAGAAEFNAAITGKHRERVDLRNRTLTKREEVGRLRIRAEQLRREAQIHESQAGELEEWCNGQDEALEGAEPIEEPRDTAALREQIDQARRMNGWIDERNAHRALQGQLLEKENEAAALTKAIDDRNRERATAIAAADMPIEGLSFGDDRVLYRGLPFEQSSTAEQLRVSVAIAMALNPKLRVIRIQHGNDLDENGMGLLAEMAAERDYQIWIERVDTSGKVGIVMEDGSVREKSIPAELTEGEEREEIIL